MTDKEKLEAIKTELHRLKEVRGVYKYVFEDIFAFINSLPEEPVSESLKDEIVKFNDNYFPETDNGLNIEMRNELRTIVGVAAKMGAQWQKEQMEKNVVLETKVYLESDGDGIESEHQEWLALENNEILDIPNNIGFKDGDKVKVIIIKDR